MDEVVKDARLLEGNNNNRTLFGTEEIGWRFKRTGQTSFFIFDSYMSIFLILLCWILMIFGKCCLSSKRSTEKWMGRFFSFTHKAH